MSNVQAFVYQASQFGLADLNLRPTLVSQLLVLGPVQPVQGISTAVLAGIPALLHKITLCLFECHTSGHPMMNVRNGQISWSPE